MPDAPGVPADDAAGLRAANARLRELVTERDAELEGLRGRLAELEGLPALVAELAAKAGQNSKNSSRPPS